MILTNILFIHVLPNRVDLLEQDSEMHRAMKGFDSYEGDTEPSQRPRKLEIIYCGFMLNFSSFQ